MQVACAAESCAAPEVPHKCERNSAYARILQAAAVAAVLKPANTDLPMPIVAGRIVAIHLMNHHTFRFGIEA